MEKNKKDTNIEVANEIGAEQAISSAYRGKITRNLVKVAEQELARRTGNDPTPDDDSINK